MTIEATAGDITVLDVEVVVNAANEHLQHGGGVALAIARAGAPVVDDESARWVSEHGPLSPGETAVTGAGSMPATWIVHVVGPRFRAGQENRQLLEEAVTAALDRAGDLGARSIALPAISAGIFGYPLDEACAVIVGTVKRWTAEHPSTLERIVLCGFDSRAKEAFVSRI